MENEATETQKKRTKGVEISVLGRPFRRQELQELRKPKKNSQSAPLPRPTGHRTQTYARSSPGLHQCC
jgi:hypothetical protein